MALEAAQHLVVPQQDLVGDPVALFLEPLLQLPDLNLERLDDPALGLDEPLDHLAHALGHQLFVERLHRHRDPSRQLDLGDQLQTDRIGESGLAMLAPGQPWAIAPRVSSIAPMPTRAFLAPCSTLATLDSAIRASNSAA